MSIHASEVLNLHKVTHTDIDFVDVTLTPDVKLFIDPCLVAYDKSPWAAQANKTIESYFDCFYSMYRDDTPDESKLALFKHAHEINATRLGYGNGHNGKAKTPEGMLSTFKHIPDLLAKGINLATASDLPLFIRDFAEDCLSDMLTNILLKNLMEFTLQQCEKYQVATVSAPAGLFYWDMNTQWWKEYTGPCLKYENRLLLLVPKNIVRNRYYFSADQFFSRVILSRMQEQSARRDSNGKVQKDSKEDIRKRVQGDEAVLDSITRLTSEDPSYLPEYHRILPSLYSGKGMSDEELDKILYT